MGANLDITYCSKKECTNLKCERNQRHLNPIIVGNHPISISDLYKNCEKVHLEQQNDNHIPHID